MDIQTSNGRGMVLKYVSSYVSKWEEAFHRDALYCSNIIASKAAFKYLITLDVCEPEMWVLLSSKKICWSNSTRKKYRAPTFEKAAEDATLNKYHERPNCFDSLSLIEWLRSVDANASSGPKHYPEGKKVLVQMAYLFFLQYLIVYYAHRQLATICRDEHAQIPTHILFFSKAKASMPEIFVDFERFCDQLQCEGHKQYYIETVKNYLNSLNDMSNLYEHRLLPDSMNVAGCINTDVTFQLSLQGQ